MKAALKHMILFLLLLVLELVENDSVFLSNGMSFIILQSIRQIFELASPFLLNFRFSLFIVHVDKQILFKVENMIAIELAYINTRHPDFHPQAVAAATFANSDEGTIPKRSNPTKRHTVSFAPSQTTGNIIINGVDVPKEPLKVKKICFFCFPFNERKLYTYHVATCHDYNVTCQKNVAKKIKS